MVATAIPESVAAALGREKPATSRNQGPDQRPKILRYAACAVSAQGANLQKNRSESTVPSPLAWLARLSCRPVCGFSGTSRKMAAAASSVSTAMPLNRPRQSV